jgi:hypothetical protein
MARKSQVMFFWTTTLCSDVVGYRCFGGPCCRVKIEAARPSETLVSYHIIVWCHNPEDHNLTEHLCLQHTTYLVEHILPQHAAGFHVWHNNERNYFSYSRNKHVRTVAPLNFFVNVTEIIFKTHRTSDRKCYLVEFVVDNTTIFDIIKKGIDVYTRRMPWG